MKKYAYSGEKKILKKHSSLQRLWGGGSIMNKDTEEWYERSIHNLNEEKEMRNIRLALKQLRAPAESQDHTY